MRQSLLDLRGECELSSFKRTVSFKNKVSPSDKTTLLCELMDTHTQQTIHWRCPACDQPIKLEHRQSISRHYKNCVHLKRQQLRNTQVENVRSNESQNALFSFSSQTQPSLPSLERGNTDILSEATG